MSALKEMPAMYEDLANLFARQGDSRKRDQCLVLAADAALSAGMPQEAERLRKRLLLTNPNHMLRPYTTMAEAMQSNDVADYVEDLRRQWPPETVEKLLGVRSPTSSTPLPDPVAPKAMAPKPIAPKPAPRKPSPTAEPIEPTAAEPIPFASFALSLVMFLVGLGIAGMLLFLALVYPLLP